MEFIHGPDDLETQFNHLLDQCSGFYGTVAWAGDGFEAVANLKRQEQKIKKFVVGLHFYQTNPAFIRKFQRNAAIRYMKITNELFHPKVYLFENASCCNILIGSFNFTNGGLNTNSESGIHLTLSTEDEFVNQVKQFIDSCWNDASVFSESELEKYEQFYNRNRENRAKLSEEYGESILIKLNKNKKLEKPSFESEVCSMSWEEFFKKVKNEKTHTPNTRLDLLDEAQRLFGEYSHFKDMPLIDRKKIAGTISMRDNINWGYFGYMGGIGLFSTKIINIEKYANISKALDEIPLQGEVIKEQYMRFVDEFSKNHALGKTWIATATRLLTMKRPDVFLCLTNKNRVKLKDDFGLNNENISYEGYWDQIIQRIRNSIWYTEHHPQDKEDERVWKYRAALLDAIYYEH
jgi:HKD family nuclease